MIATLVLDALATYRLTKLVVDDQLTAEPRDAVVQAAYAAAGRREHMLAGYEGGGDPNGYPGFWAEEVVPNDMDPPKLAILVTCPWCAGMWISLGVVAARRIAPRLWAPLAKALSFSTVSGFLAEAQS